MDEITKKWIDGLNKNSKQKLEEISGVEEINKEKLPDNLKNFFKKIGWFSYITNVEEHSKPQPLLFGITLNIASSEMVITRDYLSKLHKLKLSSFFINTKKIPEMTFVFDK